MRQAEYKHFTYVMSFPLYGNLHLKDFISIPLYRLKNRGSGMLKPPSYEVNLARIQMQGYLTSKSVY